MAGDLGFDDTYQMAQDLRPRQRKALKGKPLVCSTPGLERTSTNSWGIYSGSPMAHVCSQSDKRFGRDTAFFQTSSSDAQDCKGRGKLPAQCCQVLLPKLQPRSRAARRSSLVSWTWPRAPAQKWRRSVASPVALHPTSMQLLMHCRYTPSSPEDRCSCFFALRLLLYHVRHT